METFSTQVWGLFILGATIFGYGAAKILDAVKRLPDEQEARLRRILFDYADYLDKHKVLRERDEQLSTAGAEVLRELFQDEDSGVRKSLLLEIQRCHQEINRKEVKSDFLKSYDDLSFWEEELKRLQDRLDAESDETTEQDTD